MRFNNQFFASEEEVRAFRRKRFGVVYHYTDRCRQSTKQSIMAEVAIALEIRGEHVDLTKTPWCVAWNEMD